MYAFSRKFICFRGKGEAVVLAADDIVDGGLVRHPGWRIRTCRGEIVHGLMAAMSRHFGSGTWLQLGRQERCQE